MPYLKLGSDFCFFQNSKPTAKKSKKKKKRNKKLNFPQDFGNIHKVELTFAEFIHLLTEYPVS
jgi:hypothetical protein